MVKVGGGVKVFRVVCMLHRVLQCLALPPRFCSAGQSDTACGDSVRGFAAAEMEKLRRELAGEILGLAGWRLCLREDVGINVDSTSFLEL